MLEIYYWNILLKYVIFSDQIYEAIIIYESIYKINEAIHLFITWLLQVIYLYQFKYWFLLSSDICKEDKEYLILHQISYFVVNLLLREKIVVAEAYWEPY